MNAITIFILKSIGQVILLVLTFLLGRISSANEFKKRRNHDKSENLVALIREITGLSKRYYSEALQVRERYGLQLEIQIKIRRLSIDLHDLAICINCKSRSKYLKFYHEYHSVVTEEPFGDDGFDVEKIDRERIDRIVTCEMGLISIVRNNLL